MAGLLYPHCCTATAVNIMLGVFHVLLPCLRQGGGQVIEPVPSMVELWQAEEGELMLPTQEETEHSTGEHPKEQNFVRPSGRALHLQPSVLDFGTQSLGLPKAQTFCAFNPSRDTDVEVNSVFTTSRHFHVSPIQSRVISARGKSFFTVVFLPDEEGSFESFLYVNTSSNGILSYQVFGVGAHNSGSENFKNSDVRFPHITNIHLSQPQGDAINSSVWQVRLKCSISFRKEQQFTSCFLSEHSLLLQIYFAVRLDGSQHDLETLRKYLLENIFMIFVTADQNGSISDPFMSIYVLNSGNGLVHMQDIHHFLGDTLSVKFEPVMLLSSSINFTKAATIFFSATSHDAECSENKKLNIPEAVSPPHLCVSHKVADGFLQFDTRKVSFYMQPLQDPIGLWSVWLENNLNVPITLNEVLVAQDADGLFQILNFTHLLALLPGCWDVFTLKIQEDMLLNFLTKISIITSFGAIFEIPLHFQPAIPQPANMQFKMIGECGMHPIIRSLDAEETLHWQQSLSLGASAWTIDYELGTVLYETYRQMQDGEACRIKSSECAKIAQEKRDAESSFTFLPQLIAKPGIVVNFTATALSNSSIKYITLMNPSSFPVMVQLLPLSHYPNPQAALRLLSKWYGVSEQAIDLTTAEFTLQKQCNYGNHQLENCTVEVLELQLLPWESQRVGVVFTPLDYRKITSLIVIRNNLTVLDMITVEGVGAREMLRVGGRLPGIGGSLRFKVPESTLMDCRQQLKESKQILSITKIFKVENIGSLPITISSMKINGYKCQGFGFEVLDCNTFSLKQNSSRDIAIVFIPDFTSSWVIRELTLVSASNLEFRFTLNVTLPHHLLPLCADGVPGPSWEISFWKLTVLFVSLSLLGVILIAVQQAQYILTESLKLRHRNSTSSVPQKVSSPVDTITSESYRSSCKTFTDSSNPPDKGKGKGFLSVAAPPNRSQNASKRGPATYSHSQKKHKCSVIYSIKQKPNSTNSPTVSCDTGQQQTSDTQPPTPTKDLNCNEELVTKWTDFKSADCTDMDTQKHLTNSDTVLSKVESALQNLLLPQRTANESTLKEEPLICMFPMETNPKTSEALSEPKQQDFCVLPVSSKVCENHLVRNVSPRQNESQTISRKMEDHEIQPSSSTCRENVGEMKKQSSRDITNDKIHCNAPREERASGKSEVSLAKLEEPPYRKKGPNEKRDGVFPNLNWSKNRTSTRKNKKKNSVFPARSSEPHSDLKSKYQEVERTESRVQIRGKNWNPMINGDVCKGDQKAGRLHTGGETECYQGLRKKCVEKVSSDSSSDCSSSRGSVRASRGSWGSWSSTSSSDGDKKNIIPSRHFFPPRDNRSHSVFPVDPPISLNLSHSICNTSSDKNSITHYPEIISPSLTESEKNQGLFSQEDVWSTQPICMTSDLNYNAENTVSCVMRNPPPVQNDFINWNSTCDSQFSGMYGPLELNNYNAFTEENMNYHNSFPCSDVQNPAFIDHQCHSTWNMSTSAAPPAPSPVPSAWEPASFVSTSPYLSSTRSLSPMSGLFGSIWAPQNDLYDGYCAVSSSPPHSDRIGSHSVLCKQEYSPRFNPFHAYMNLDISTTAANRNTNYPISRDSGYCGNM
ncbi:transmembrane protein 131-like [Bombina bombina]|uniref:transmembrane protein 131-like n=1 Tax=Bombina bombina TaxID=8345 RepID=UPI00235A764F|nr:transmembrane protein 131-like [Bombina bombina]